MLQVRKLVLAVAVATALSSGAVQALGLGELTLKSTLNQPLLAEVELLDVHDLSAAELQSGLASAEDFAKAGVDRKALLDDMTFTPIINANGKSVIRITSTQPISEPYVKFLVQVLWPSGRLMRDYSLLLDPSTFAGQNPEAAQPSAVVTPVAPITSSSAKAPAQQYTTNARDTLWEIAAKVRNGASVQQNMLAIQALNPDAFIDGNINRLKRGQVLRLPDAEQGASLPQTTAIAEVSTQNAAWRQGRRGASVAQQVDATRQDAVTPPVSGAAKPDSLRLVSGNSNQNKGAVMDGTALRDKLATTQENLDVSERENAELKSRMQDLQSQLDKLQRLLQLRNEQLARLEAQTTSGAAPAQPIPAQGAPVLESVAQPAVQPVENAKKAPVTSDTERSVSDLLASPILLGLLGGSALLVTSLLMLLLVRRRNARQEAQKHMQMAQALSQEADFSVDLDLSDSCFEGLEVAQAAVSLPPALDAPAPEKVVAKAPEPSPAPDVSPPVVAAAVATQPDIVPVATYEAELDPTDVLQQALTHIERGRMYQAADLLEDELKREPQRSDLRLKLMEVYGLQRNGNGFITQERQLIAHGMNRDEVEQLKSRFPQAAMIAGAGALGAAAFAAAMDAQYIEELMLDSSEAFAAIPAAPEDALDHAFDLSLDELEAASPSVPVSAALFLRSDSNFASALQQRDPAGEESDEISDIDFDLDLQPPAPVEPGAEALVDRNDALFDLSEPSNGSIEGFELPLSDDFDLSLADEPAQSPADDADFDFLSVMDEAATKLDLAQAYIDMGDAEGARDILDEVLGEGSESQKTEAKDMLQRLA